MFLFKQKTAYELRISDWSSDVGSSDRLPRGTFVPARWPGLLPSAGGGLKVHHGAVGDQTGPPGPRQDGGNTPPLEGSMGNPGGGLAHGWASAGPRACVAGGGRGAGIPVPRDRESGGEGQGLCVR